MAATATIERTTELPAENAPVLDPAWVVGTCPQCGGPLVENEYYTGGQGWAWFLECWEGLGENGTCPHKRERV